MRAHFPGALREMRSAARFRLGVFGVWIPREGSFRDGGGQAPLRASHHKASGFAGA